MQGKEGATFYKYAHFWSGILQKLDFIANVDLGYWAKLKD